MPPAPEETPLPLPLPLPQPQPPKPEPDPPKPKPKGPEPMPKPAGPLPERDAATSRPDDLICGGADACAGPCAYLPHCHPPPPPSRGATLHLRSGRLPTPLIALSASLLAVSAALLLALLVHRLVARRRRRRAAALAAQFGHGEEGGGGGHHVLAGAVAAQGVPGGGEEEEADGGVHHVWYIRTKGLDERAIAAIAAVVYDAKKRGGGGAGKGGGTDAGDGDDGGGSCAVCLAEFRDGETLRLLPRCAHAFHRGCIDTWLRAHVNCPLCRAPVQVQVSALAAGAAANPTAAAGAPSGRRQESSIAGVVQAEEETAHRAGGVGGGGVADERGVRRSASMVALPRRAWPDAAALRAAPASSSGREADMAAGLGKVRRLLKLSDALDMVGVGVERSVSFGAGSWQRLAARSSGPSAAAAGVSVSADETSQ